MQNAESILQAMRKLGSNRLPLTRVYRSLYSEDLFLAAYAKIYRNQGALTPGTEDDTVDGMSLQRIQKIIVALRYERFRFRPARRIHIPKKKGGTRPLGLPNFSDKLVQEVIRMLLEAYYEPRFRDSSHGFRPQRGCHTALVNIKHRCRGTAWFIEGDIKGCFDTIDHDILMTSLQRDIHDRRLLRLIRQGLKAGVMEGWKYHVTHSGTPQGGILSPLLANIYLNQLDTFVEDELIPQYTRGEARVHNIEYRRVAYELEQAKRQGNVQEAKRLKLRLRQLPSKNPQDPNFRRLRYIRYADDFILSFIGPKIEAVEIRDQIQHFLEAKLGLTMSLEKTLITHARTQHAHFLGYAISTYHANDKLSVNPDRGGFKRRSANGRIRLGIPYGRVDACAREFQRRGKPYHDSRLIDCSDAHIIAIFQARFRGIAEYYKYAVDRYRLSKLKYAMEQTLVKTLARKYQCTSRQIYARYHGQQIVNGKTYKTLQLTIPTASGTRIIFWGAIPLTYVKQGIEPIPDTINYAYHYVYSDLIQRLQADTCELCGAQDHCEVHHVRKLADLKQRWANRKHVPSWVKRMIAMQRKTLVVCRQCHMNIHAGRPIPNSRMRTLESRVH